MVCVSGGKSQPPSQGAGPLGLVPYGVTGRKRGPQMLLYMQKTTWVGQDVATISAPPDFHKNRKAMDSCTTQQLHVT